MNVEKELLALKEKIERAKVEKAQAEGALTELEKRLSSEFGLDEYIDVERKLDEIEEEIKDVSIQIEDKMKDIREKFDV